MIDKISDSVPTKADVVVVGSGISGLTSAALLSNNGKKVVLLEKQSSFGGALRQFKRRRIPYDVGFHYTGCLGEGEVLRNLWAYCGVLKDINIIPLYPEGYDHFEFRDSDKKVKGYFTYQKFREELVDKFPQEVGAIDSYFSTVKKICQDVPFYNMDSSLKPFLRGYKSRPSSFLNYLNSITKDPYLQTVFAAPLFLYGVPLEYASLEAHALVSHGYYSGAYAVSGGGQSIVDAFMKSLRDSGVTLLKNTQLISVLADGNTTTGVEVEGIGRIDCDQVIYTGHPATVPDIVPDSVFRPAYRKRLQGLKNSLSMFAVFGESEKYVDTLDGPKNYYLFTGKDEILLSTSDTSISRRPMMLTNTCSGKYDSLQVLQNGIILLCPAYWQDVKKFEKSSHGSRPDEYERMKRDVAAEIIETAEQRWGNISGSIEPLAVGTPLTFMDELSAPSGCAYGAMHCLDQFNPDVRTRLDGFYLAGQSTLMTGVVGSSLSSLVCAGEILGLESLWEKVKKCS